MEKKNEGKKTRSIYIIHENELLSKHMHTLLLKAKKNVNISDQKNYEIRLLLEGVDHLLVSIIQDETWREGIWFVAKSNFKDFIKFDKSIHKIGYGNDNIVWPTIV